MEPSHPLRDVTDEELLKRLKSLVAQSNRLEAVLVAHIGEVDERRLYARLAFSSMFTYCTQALHLSEAVAYRRIAVARAARRYPVLLAMLQDGRLHLTGLALLAPLLTDANCNSLLTRATHRSKRELEELVAELSPRPDVTSAMRKLPARGPSQPEANGAEPRPPGGDGSDSALDVTGPEVSTLPAPSELSPGRVATVPIAAARETPERIEPLSPTRYKVQFTASASLRDKLERLKALMRSEVPSGDLALILEQAVTEKLARMEAKRFGATRAPRRGLEETSTTPASRHVPAAVRRAVHERDGGSCRFVDEQGRRCSERVELQFHHRHPFGMGGDHSPGNICLLCPTHNRLMAEFDYGARAIPGPRPRARDAT